MSINIVLEKKHVYVILGVITIFAAMIFVLAVTSNPGHTASEIDVGSFDNDSYTFPGSVIISGIGGNVPHGCYRKSTYSASASSLTVSCATGEITVGGGVSCGSPVLPATKTEPSSDLTYWTGSCSGTADMYAYAVCCKI